MAFTTGILEGTYLTWDGDPASGLVEIIPNSRVLIDSEGDVILSGRVKVTLDAEGSFEVELPSTDDATVQPALDRQYTVSAKLRHGHLPAVTGILLPGGSTVNMADVTSSAALTASLSEFLTEAEYDALVARVDDLETSPGGVVSVNTETGTVVLDAADVGADPAGSAAAVAGNLTTEATTRGDADTALDGRLDTAEADLAGRLSDLTLSATYVEPTAIVRASGGDDSANIQAALDAGKWVHFPDALYLVGTGLVMSVQGTKLTGTSWLGGTVLKATTVGMDVLRVSAARCVVSDLDINCDNKAVSGMLFHIANRGEFSRISVYTATGAGYRFDLDATATHGNNNILKFVSCWSRNNAGHGWAIPVRDGDNNGIEWYGCEGSSNGQSGILYKGSGAKIIGGIYHANRNYGIELGEAADGSTTAGVHMVYPWMEANGLFTGSAMTSGTTTLTSGTSGWRAVQIGSPVTVPGAGVAGAALEAKVASINSLTSVELDTAASTTVSGQTVNSPSNGVYTSTKAGSCTLWAPTAQQGIVSADTFGRCVQVSVQGNGEYDIAGAQGRGLRVYGRTGATSRVQLLPSGTDTDMRLDLHGKGAGGVQLGDTSGKVGFLGTAPIVKPAVTGTRADSAALASLLTQLAGLGLVTDSSTAGSAALGTAAIAVKTADLVINTNAVLADDAHLTLPVVANATYLVESWIPYDSATAADLALKFTAPASSVLAWSPLAMASNATTTLSATVRQVLHINSALTLGGIGVGTKAEGRPTGTLTTAGTAGNLTIQFAQATSDATNTTVHTGAYLKLTRVS